MIKLLLLTDEMILNGLNKVDFELFFEQIMSFFDSKKTSKKNHFFC